MCFTYNTFVFYLTLVFIFTLYNYIIFNRTDAGVHALHTTLHVDLQRYDLQPYNLTTLTTKLNRNFYKHCLPIRVLGVQQVSNDFHCRYHATARTYLYRFAIAKSSKITEESINCIENAFIPVEELDRCYFIQ